MVPSTVRDPTSQIEGTGLICSGMLRSVFGLFVCCLASSCLALSCLVLSCLTLPCPRLVLPCLVLPCLALSCLALPCLALSCLASSCLALSCLALPCLALPWHSLVALPCPMIVFYFCFVDERFVLCIVFYSCLVLVLSSAVLCADFEFSYLCVLCCVVLRCVVL
jgi:hypothetical protein